MKLDPGMHIGMHLVSFGKSGVTGACRRPCSSSARRNVKEKRAVVSLPNMHVRVTLTSWSTNQTPTQVNLARLVHINQTKCLHNASLATASHGQADGPGPHGDEIKHAPIVRLNFLFCYA
jgi:hypothetical protein